MDNEPDAIVLDPEGRDIQGEIARIRERGPVTRIVLPGGVPAWSVTGASEVETILSSPDVSKDPRQHWPAFRAGEIGKSFPLLQWVNTRSMFTAYGDDHRKLRKVVTPAFTPKRITALRPRIGAITEDLLNGLAAAPADRPVDLRQGFAYPLPLQVINELIGVPENLRPDLRRCVDGVFDISATEEQSVANYAEIMGLLEDLVKYRWGNRGENLTTTLIEAVENPDNEFSKEELVGTLYLTINAGHETTVSLIEQAIFLLLTHPQYQAAVFDEITCAEVIEEVLRFEAPAAHVPLRYAVRDIDFGEVRIMQGDVILVSYAGAGRDPQVHGASADTFDPTRQNKKHLSFGYGAHFCLGPNLARLEAKVALPALFQRFPDMKLAVPPHELGSVPGFIANGHSSLPVLLNS